jgi:hypothetical protein
MAQTEAGLRERRKPVRFVDLRDAVIQLRKEGWSPEQTTACYSLSGDSISQSEPITFNVGLGDFCHDLQICSALIPSAKNMCLKSRAGPMRFLKNSHPFKIDVK